MEEYFFIGLIVVFAILDSIARSRKAKQRGQLPQGGAEDDRASHDDWEVPSHEDDRTPHDDWEVPSHDDDRAPQHDREVRSHDGEDAYGTPGELLPTYEGPHASASGRGVAGQVASEGMVPADVWEEIAGLARGAQKEILAPEPTPVPEPTRSTRVPARYTASRPAHRVHGSHAGYGTDPSGRAPSEQDGLDPLAKALSPDASTVRSMLTAKGTHALRQAVVLHEVLASPVSMRDDESE